MCGPQAGSHATRPRPCMHGRNYIQRMRSLNESWRLGPLTVPNRVLLAPLAGIGNWFVRLQAKRHGAGMAVSEMVSSYAVHYGNPRTCNEMLRIDPREREGGPVSIQLFGEDPDVMRSAAAHVAAAGADAIDINMGCPVPKVRKTGAGVQLLADPDRAVALARAAVDGAAQARGPGAVPVTVKLRSGLRPGDDAGFHVAHRLVADAGVAAIAFHPRAATVHHRGTPDYDLVARLVDSLPAPVILTGGLSHPDAVRSEFARTGVEAVMLARGTLGNPWLFEQLLGRRTSAPSRDEVLAELDWTLDAACEHLGAERAGRYLRKFYPWYVARLRLPPGVARSLLDELQHSSSPAEARALLGTAIGPGVVAV